MTRESDRTASDASIAPFLLKFLFPWVNSCVVIRQGAVGCIAFSISDGKERQLSQENRKEKFDRSFVCRWSAEGDMLLDRCRALLNALLLWEDLSLILIGGLNEGRKERERESISCFFLSRSRSPSPRFSSFPIGYGGRGEKENSSGAFLSRH